MPTLHPSDWLPWPWELDPDWPWWMLAWLIPAGVAVVTVGMILLGKARLL
jgi:hypothetical protein